MGCIKSRKWTVATIKIGLPGNRTLTKTASWKEQCYQGKEHGISNYPYCSAAYPNVSLPAAGISFIKFETNSEKLKSSDSGPRSRDRRRAGRRRASPPQARVSPCPDRGVGERKEGGQEAGPVRGQAARCPSEGLGRRAPCSPAGHPKDMPRLMNLALLAGRHAIAEVLFSYLALQPLLPSAWGPRPHLLVHTCAPAHPTSRVQLNSTQIWAPLGLGLTSLEHFLLGNQSKFVSRHGTRGKLIRVDGTPVPLACCMLHATCASSIAHHLSKPGCHPA